MEKDEKLFTDFDSVRSISVKSLESGTTPDVLEKTLIKIGLTKAQAADVIKQARAEIRKKKRR